MFLPKIGSLAPNFALLNQSGETIELKQFCGRSNVIIYFYPKASTPGCTTQACGLRDTRAEFKALNCVVLGISPDAPEKLLKFDHKYDLGLTLLSDVDHSVAESYGVWALKKFMGREFMGIVRTTFVVDSSGKLSYIIDKVNTKTHDQDVLTILKSKI